MTGVGLKTQRTHGGQRTTMMTSVGHSYRGHARSEDNRDDISGAQPQGAREVRGQSWRVGLPPLHGF